MILKARSMRIGVVGMAVASLSLAGLTGCGSSSGESASSAGPDIAKIADPAERAIEAVRQADRQIKSKDIGGATRSLSLAQAAVNEIRDPAKQADLLTRIGGAYNRAGKKGDAAKVAQRATAAVKKIDDVKEKLTSASKLVSVMVRADEKGAGLNILRTVEPELVKIEDYGARASAKCDIAVAYFTLGKTAESKRIVEELKKPAPDADEEQRVTALIAVGNAQLKLNDKAAAKTTFDDAAAQADKIPSLSRRAWVLCDIARGYQAAGDDTAKNKILDKAGGYAEKDPQPDLGHEAKNQVSKTRRELR
jgi:tetratricopeptide (TPR) repeat protein